MYDYLVVGSGLFGCTFAHELHKKGKKVLVLERRNQVGGNIRCEEREGIQIHLYGAHIFHTFDRDLWEYVNQFVEFNHYVNSPIANYRGELFNLPFNMNTFYQMWGVNTPADAMMKINEQRGSFQGKPRNLEEQAISLVGIDIYQKLIKGYTEKQWGKKCTELPISIVKRIPVRYTFDNSYFNDTYQGIPIGGYNELIDKLLYGIEVRTGVDFNKHRLEYIGLAKKIVYSGTIDEYFDYELGSLEYRGLRFETKRYDEENHQGVAVMNYTDYDIPWTRTIEHKHFEFSQQPVTYVTTEYPVRWQVGDEPYYPINDRNNQALYFRYAEKTKRERNVIFGGRLAEYQYYDMDDVMRRALDMAKAEL